MKKLTVTELEEQMRAGADCQVLDVREAAEYETERIHGARLTPLSSFTEHVSGIDAHRPVYLLCRSGNRATQAATRMAQLGYDNVHVVEGGLQAWRAAGLPMLAGESKTWALERQVRFAAGSLVLLGAILALAVHPWFVGLSAFVGAGLVFSAVTDNCAMAMVLARMPWNQRTAATVGNPLVPSADVSSR